MKLCVVIPAYNEANTIGAIINRIFELGLNVLIIDDGSKDNTAEVASACGAKVLRNERNLGKGAALITGFKYALKNGFDGVITLDGDGQHSPLDIPIFLEALNNSGNQIIIGNRMLKQANMPFIRVLTNKFMSWLISLMTKQKIPDTQCGFRLIKSDALRKLDLRTSKYETESEILIKSARLGFKIESVPINTIYGREKSQINPFSDTIRFFKLLARELFWVK